jgi:DNA-binding response OmpR family regulator
LLRSELVPSPRAILLVESDEGCSRSLAVVLRRQGDRVHVARTRGQALQAARRRPYDLAVVDLFLRGGGAELARDLARSVPQLYLSFGARLLQHEILEAALGFPVCRKASLPGLLRSRVSSKPSRSRGSSR